MSSNGKRGKNKKLGKNFNKSKVADNNILNKFNSSIEISYKRQMKTVDIYLKYFCNHKRGFCSLYVRNHCYYHLLNFFL